MEAQKIALITGCLGGIGQALISAFMQDGYLVVGVDVADEPGLSDLFRRFT